MRSYSLLKLLYWILFFEILGYLLGMITQANIYPWYENLNKSSFTPPGFVFSVVWSGLYTVLAIIAWRLYTQNKKSSVVLSYLFAIQMLMNWLWTPLFFHFHWLTLSAMWLVCLTGLNFILWMVAQRKDKLIAFLLTPYLLWLLFASYLNVFIAWMN